MKSEMVKEFDEALNLWLQDGVLADSVFSATDRELFELCEVLAAIARYHTRATRAANANFSFTASESLSGGRNPCASPACRMDKVSGLISFATLYADEVFIKNPFEGISLREEPRINMADRYEILSGITTYDRLKPLMRSGLIKYAIDRASFCEAHFESLAKPLMASIKRKKEALRRILKSELGDKCRVILTIQKRTCRSTRFQGRTV